MAKGFSDAKGKHDSGAKVASYEWGRNGLHKMRLFGGIVPRYLYWVKNSEGKSLPFECLAFDRESERFTNVERDVVQEHFPKDKCSWGYAMLGLDLNDGEPKVRAIHLKKKLYEQIRSLADDLGDPTDPEDGWDIIFERVSTGSHAFNVEYILKAIKCQNAKRELTAEEREAIDKAPSVDEAFPRETVEQQEQRLQKFLRGKDKEEDEVPDDVASELDEDGESISDLD